MVQSHRTAQTLETTALWSQVILVQHIRGLKKVAAVVFVA